MTIDLNERQLRLALRNVPVPMLAHDETGRIRYLSDTLLRLTGYSREQIPTFRAWLELAYGDVATVERLLEVHRALYGGSVGALPAGGEYRVRVADGSHRVWRFNAYSIGHDDDGLAVNVSMAADVTGERASLDALARSEAILRQALRVGEAGSFERPFGERVTLMSDELIDMLGLPPEARREPFEALYARVHPEDRVRVVTYIERLLDPGAALSVEYRAIRPADGAERRIAERREVRRDGQGRPVGCVGLQRDVTDARAAEEALRVGEERLRLSLELGQVGTFDWNLVRNTLSWDARTREIWGLTSDAPVSVRGFYDGVHPDDRESLTQTIARSHAAGGDGGYEVEYRVLNARDGRIRCVSARGRTLFEHGRAVRMMGVAVDVTTLRDASALIERDRAELERLVEARTRELADAQTRLAHAQRMEALGQLAGGIAHDFNNVLQAIEAAADLIERRPEPAHLPRYLRMAREATRRGSAISRRLGSLSRRSELEPERVSVARSLEDVAAVLRRTAPSSLSVVVDVPADPPWAFADRRQLEAALLNLAANAREAMDDDGVLTLRARADTSRAARDSGLAAQLSSGDYVRVEVADNGHGMSPDVRARAAEPFFSTKPRGQGVGLGLSMARGFADQSGGALSIDSTPGEGAAIAFWLPVAEAPCEAPSPRLVRRGGLLMVVDDDPLVRELMGEQLRFAGYEVAAFCDGAAALAGLDAGLTPDLLLTDFSMPQMNGVDLARAVRQRRPRLPVLLLTGCASDAVDAVGDDEFPLLRKPIDADALIGRVSGLIKAD
jgi:PAS domain S-box-containing protein